MTTIATPSGLTATVVNGNSVKLDWVDNSNNEQGFLIERKTTGDYSLLAVVAANVITYTDATVVADTGYYYRLRGYLTESNAYIYFGKRTGAWSSPEGLIRSADGFYFWLSDTGANRIRKYDVDLTTAQVSVFGSSGSGAGNDSFSSPKGIEDNGAGHLYICDSGNNRIKKMTTGGSYVNEVGSSGTGNSQFNSPCGIALQSSLLYIADRDNHRIMIRNSGDLTYVGKFGKDDATGASGSGDGEFIQPYGVAVDANYIFVTDKDNDRIQVFNLASPYAKVGEFGKLNSSGLTAGVGDVGAVIKPTGICISGAKVFVSDSSNSRIQIFQAVPPFSYVGKTGSNGTGNGQFTLNGAYGITITGSKIYVIDKAFNSNAGRIMAFNNS